MQINTQQTRNSQRRDVRNQSTTLSEGESNTGKYLGAAAIAGGGVALGAGMLFPDEVSSMAGAIKDSVGPTIEAVAPIVGGVLNGAMYGGMTGAGFGMVATMKETDSTPVWAALGGGMGGLALGAVVGGVSAAFGATPMLAIPAVLIGGAAFKVMA